MILCSFTLAGQSWVSSIKMILTSYYSRSVSPWKHPLEQGGKLQRQTGFARLPFQLFGLLFYQSTTLTLLVETSADLQMCERQFESDRAV